MKNKQVTGLFRRLDALGRIVIPKEYRRAMHLFEDDLAEIILCDQQLIIKKHQPLTSMQSLCQQYLIAYAKNSGVPCIICNTENILAVRGVSLSTSARFSDDVSSYIRNKQIFHFTEDAALDLIGDGKYPIDCLYPIVS